VLDVKLKLDRATKPSGVDLLAAVIGIFMRDGKILVTGAAGFIGFHVAQRLLGAGREVVGLDVVNDYYDPRLKEARLDMLKAVPGFSFIKLNSSIARR